MIISLLYGLWIFLVNTVIDGAVYLIVDYFVKAAIRNASSEEEKGVIWLGECILLFVVSLLIYVTSHTPYLLLVMVGLTLAFTQIRGQVNLVYWWYQLLSRWDEFKLHEQSMEEFQKRRIPAPPPPAGPAPLRNIPLSTDPPDYPRPFHVSPRKPLRQDMAAYANPESLYQRYQSQPLLNQQHQQQHQQLQQQHHHQQQQQQQQPVRSRSADPPKIVVRQATTFTSKIKSVLGMGEQIPAGLKNNGQNLCFMNSILQCIARSPRLVERLEKGVERDGCSYAESELVRSTKILLKQLLNPTDYRLFNNVDTVGFRKAASDLQPAMIAPPSVQSPPSEGEPGALQRQQDAAELLMWLLDVMHDSMNQASGHIDTDAPLDLSRIYPESLSSWNHLRIELGTPSLSKLVQLKRKYLREIEVTSGMDRAPESLQRLADLEWILHKLNQRSVWNDLFSGQLVECQHCLTCSRLSVGIQTFTVLPVPIVDPRSASGFVYLEDCFSKFVNTENLFGKEGLCCPCSNPAKRGTILHGTPAKTPVRPRLLSADSAVHSPSIGQPGFMSPIPSVGGTSLNDSGFPEQFRTSTPIADGPIFTNGQRRALLRQLPSCLTIQLMRFRYNQRYHDQSKVHTPVHIPLRGLSLGSMIFDDNNDGGASDDDDKSDDSKYSYDLYAMCLHLGTGTTNVGHYVAYCCDARGAWWKLDDEDVTQINMDFELNSRLVRENAYILFYKRRDS